MALVGRVTILWILTSLFMLFVVLKLDGTTEWTWFVVFVPMWVLDLLSVIYLIVFIISHYRQNQGSSLVSEFNISISKVRKFWLVGMFILKITFLVELCCKLDGFMDVSFVYVFLPFWVLLLMLIFYSYAATWKEGKKRMNTEQPLRLGLS